MERFWVALWWLDRLTAVRALLEPLMIVPKFRFAGEAVTGDTPVPDKPTTCGLVLSLSVTVTAPG
jgi:hypothetical protein